MHCSEEMLLCNCAKSFICLRLRRQTSCLSPPSTKKAKNESEFALCPRCILFQPDLARWICNIRTLGIGLPFVGNALMLLMNGPPLEHWSPRKYVISWLITGRQGALYKPIGLPKSPDNWQCLQTVYQLVYHLIVCCIGWMCRLIDI